MSIVTVTLNPAIDQTILVNNFEPNEVNRVQSMQLDAGGKGVNVASFLADFGLSVTVTGFLGLKNATIFEEHFHAKGIDDRFIYLPGYTRTNIKIMDNARQQTTDINNAGEAPAIGALIELDNILSELADSKDWFVLSGNLPPGVPADIYARLIASLKAHGKKVVLDTSRDALTEGLKSAPTIAKPNIDELRQLTGQDLNDISQVKSAARQLISHGIELVVVSMGKDGALFVDENFAFMAVPPSVTVKTTVGAGDAMVAGLVAGKSQGMSLEECARLATSFSLGAITSVGAHLPEAAVLKAYAEQVQIHYLVE